MTGKTCPSARCAPGAQLLGVLGEDGRIKRLRTMMTVNEEFVATAAAKGKPEYRMRFAAPCAESDCAQWTGSKCSVAERILEQVEAMQPGLTSAKLPVCAIRATCRWYDQRGDTACQACDLVVTERSEIAVE